MTMTDSLATTIWRTVKPAPPPPAPTVPEPGNAAGSGEVGRRNEATRLRWVEDALAAIPAGWRLLDAGAGDCRHRGHCAHLRYVSQDVHRPDPADVGSRIDIVSDVTSIPEPDGSFDAVLCSEAFDRMPDPLAALREFARLLRPGGRLVLTVPFHCATGDWHREHLSASGFSIIRVEENGNFFEFLAQEMRRLGCVAGRYAGGALSAEEHAAIGTLLGALDRFSASDTGSGELLCFGLHVIAERR